VQQAPSAVETCSPGIVISVLGLRINHCDSTAIAFDSCLHFAVPIALDSRGTIYQIPEGRRQEGTDFGGTESVARHAITNLSLLSKSSSNGQKKPNPLVVSHNYAKQRGSQSGWKKGQKQTCPYHKVHLPSSQLPANYNALFHNSRQQLVWTESAAAGPEPWTPAPIRSPIGGLNPNPNPIRNPTPGNGQ